VSEAEVRGSANRLHEQLEQTQASVASLQSLLAGEASPSGPVEIRLNIHSVAIAIAIRSAAAAIRPPGTNQ